jgi:GT2 family glycosyltransferase
MPETIIKKSKPMIYGGFNSSPVSIIIPFHGCYEKVSRLVKSILFATRSNPYEICLVDDASKNKNFINEMSNVPQVNAIRSDKHVGFGGALKIGFERTQQPWVVFLHSDCKVEDINWLMQMGKSLLNLKKNNVRMISARSNNPGEEFKRLKSAKTDKNPDIILQNVRDGFLPLYCTMCHRELFANIGGFIKNYYPIGYEDEELAYRMNYHGFKQAICGRSWIHHEGGATKKQLCIKDKNFASIIEENREKCENDIKNLYSKHK